jgi:TolA-binding protein
MNELEKQVSILEKKVAALEVQIQKLPEEIAKYISEKVKEENQIAMTEFQKERERFKSLSKEEQLKIPGWRYLR